MKDKSFEKLGKKLQPPELLVPGINTVGLQANEAIVAKDHNLELAFGELDPHDPEYDRK